MKRRACAVMCVCVGCATSVLAVSNRWDTTKSGVWSDAANWVAGGVPVSSAETTNDFYELTGGWAAPTRTSSNDVANPLTLNRLQFEGIRVGDGYSIRQVNGGALMLTNAGSRLPSIDISVNHGNGNTYNYFTVFNDLVLATNLNVTGNGSVGQYGLNSLFIFNGNITETNGSHSVVKTGTSYWRLGGSNSWSGGTTVSAGGILIRGSDGLGTGTVTLNSGLLWGENNSVVVTNAIALTATSGLGGRSLTEVTGPVTTGAFSLNVNGGHVLHFAPSSLSGATGAMTIEDGALHVGPSMADVFSGNLYLYGRNNEGDGGVFVLDGAGAVAPTWDTFTANRSGGYGTGAAQWRIGSTTARYGGFAAKGTRAVISASGGTFDRDFRLGHDALVDGAVYCDAPVEIASKIVLGTAQQTRRSIKIAQTGPGWTRTAAEGVCQYITGGLVDLKTDAGIGNISAPIIVARNAYGSADDRVAELVLAGTNAWQGSGYAVNLNTGPGGLMLNAGPPAYVRFTTPGALPGGVPAGKVSFLASVLNQNTSAGDFRNGFLFTGAAQAQVYNLASRRLALLLGEKTKLESHVAGAIGARGGRVTLENADVYTYWDYVAGGGGSGPTRKLGLLADLDSVLTLGSPASSVRFYYVRPVTFGGADTGVTGDATALMDYTNPPVGVGDPTVPIRRLQKVGGGTVVLCNVRYVHMDQTDWTSQFQWIIGRAAANPASTPYFDGAVRGVYSGGGTNSLIDFAIQLRGGVYEVDATGQGAVTWSPAIGTAAGNVLWTPMNNNGADNSGGGGFAAFGGDVTVDLNGGGADSLTWNSTPFFLQANDPLLFGSLTADGVVTLVDNVALNGATREVRVIDNPAAAGDRAVLAGVLSGNASSHLLKSGDGSLVLAGTNTYAGATTVAAGTLVVNGALAAGGATVTVQPGATLAGTGTVERAVVADDAATLAPGDGGAGVLAVGDLVVAGDLTRLAFDLGASPTGMNDRVDVTGSLTLDGVLEVTDLGRFGLVSGNYTLFTYTATLVDNGLTVATLPNRAGGTIETNATAVWLAVTPTPLPIVTNDGGATNLTPVSADLQGELFFAGASLPTVSVFWGLTDGVTGAWDHVETFAGPQAEGPLATNVTGLAAGTAYYYRYYASNDAGFAWADASVCFTTPPPARIVNAGATDIEETTATLNGTLTDTQAVTTVKVFWGTADGGTGTWAYGMDLGEQAAGPVSAVATGLLQGTQYFYRYYATNLYGEVWAPASSSFLSGGTPRIQNGGVANRTATSADVYGSLVSTGAAPTTVFVFWGASDGGTDKSAWSHTNTLAGTPSPGLVMSTVTPLTPEVRYYYRFYATNALGDDWADSTADFYTPGYYHRWENQIDAPWSIDSVWATGRVPFSAAETVIEFKQDVTVADYTKTSSNDVADPLVLNKLTLSGAGTANGNMVRNITGGGLLFTNNGATVPSIALDADGNSGNRSHTFNVYTPITLATNLGVTGNGYDGIYAASTVFRLLGDIDELGGARSITKTGLSYLRLGGTNTYSGGTFINGGAVHARSSAAFGSGAVRLAAGTALRGEAQEVVLTNRVTLAGAATLGGYTAYTELAGPLDLGGFNLTVDGGHILNVNASSVSNATGAMTVNPGALRIQAADLPAGNLNLAGGVLLLDGSGTTAPSWADFTAARPGGYGTGAGQWQLTAVPAGGFAARATAETISGLGTNEFNRNFRIGSYLTAYGQPYANVPLTLDVATTLTGLRTATCAGAGPGFDGSVTGGVFNVLAGTWSGVGALVLQGHPNAPHTDGMVGELVLGGTYTYTGTSYGSDGERPFSAGPGGLFMGGYAGYARFASPAALPTGATNTAYLAAMAAGYNTPSYRFGFWLTGGSGGVDYALSAPYAFVIGGTDNSSVGDHGRAGVLGTHGGDVTLSRAAVHVHKSILTANQHAQSLMLPVREGVFTLGAQASAVTFTPARGEDPNVLSLASPATPLVTSAGTRTLIAAGKGRVLLRNVNYRDVALSGDTRAQFIWQLGRGVAGNTGAGAYLEGIVREGGGGPQGTVEGMNLLLAGGVLEASRTLTCTIGTGASQCRFAAGGGGFAAFGGPLTVSVSGLTWAGANSIPDGEPLIFNSPAATDRVTWTGPVNLNGGAREIRVIDNPATAGDDAVVSGALTGGGASGLIKTGAGRLTLSGASTYDGTTTVREGELVVDGSLDAGGLVTVQAGTTLSGVGTLARAVTVASGATLAPARTNAVGTLATGALTLASGSRTEFDVGAIANADAIAVTGKLVLDGTLYVRVRPGLETGLYPLFTYTGPLTDNGVRLGTQPPNLYSWLLDMSQPGTVYLNIVGSNGIKFIVR